VLTINSRDAGPGIHLEVVDGTPIIDVKPILSEDISQR
jgi:hypothetical protein